MGGMESTDESVEGGEGRPVAGLRVETTVEHLSETAGDAFRNDGEDLNRFLNRKY